jgi:HEAT repeat protein
MNNRRLLTILILEVMVSSLAFPESQGTSDEDRIQSIIEERQDILRYGIETEVIDLLTRLKEEKSTDLVEEVGELFDSTSNPRIQRSCIDLFLAIKEYRFADTALSILEEYDGMEIELVRALSSYIAEAGHRPALPLFERMLESADVGILLAAIGAVGKMGDPDYAKILLSRMEKDDTPKEAKLEIIRALGLLKSKDGIETLTEILENADEQASWRWAACEALGRIGERRTIPVLMRAYESQDATLRSYAVAAMRGFSGKETERFLIDALRDSFWRVRVSAAESLGQLRSEEALSILVYKARRDPEVPVRSAAIKAMGEIGTEAAFAQLREMLTDEKLSETSRIQAGEILVEKDLSRSFQTIEAVLAKEWDKERSALLGSLCKFLSTARWPGLEAVFDRMLSHKELTIKIYGLRGIRLNRFTGLRERVAPLAEKGFSEAIRKYALDTLSALDEN